MEPGEAYRLARVVALPWTASPGPDGGAGYNVLRRFLRRHKVPLHADGLPAGVIFSANNYDRWGIKNETDNKFLIDATKAVGLEAYWHDAAWFVGEATLAAGQWHLPLVETEDRRDFPSGIGIIV